MADLTLSDDALRRLLREAVAEAFEDRRDLLREIVVEAMEDVGLAEAIREGQRTARVSEAEVLDALRRP